MKQITRRSWIYGLIIIVLASCKENDTKTQFEISGVITNGTVPKIYLEESQAGGSGRTIIDSFNIGKDGKYTLKTKTAEAMLYGIRLSNQEFPAIYVINDAPGIVVDISLDKQNNEMIEKYDIKQSVASNEMKNFVSSFDSYLMKLYVISRKADSLKNQNAPDSLMALQEKGWHSVSEDLRSSALAQINKANNPALILFEIGYFQEVNRRYTLESLTLEEVNTIVNRAADKFPIHKGLTAIKKQIEEQLAAVMPASAPRWVGKPAPDFTLPDVSGNPVSLSSFKGKYVLVDFWASWCGPCRAENPNVVDAFNKFQSKNFTILGVSLDKPGEKDKWLKAIKQDGLTWTHVSDLKHWESLVIPLYGFDGIPYNVLVDTAGIIIGENLRGRALEVKLEEVLK